MMESYTNWKKNDCFVGEFVIFFKYLFFFFKIFKYFVDSENNINYVDEIKEFKLLMVFVGIRVSIFLEIIIVTNFYNKDIRFNCVAEDQ